MFTWNILMMLSRLSGYILEASDEIFSLLDQKNLYGETIGEVLFGALLPLFLLRLAKNIFVG